MAVYNGYLWQGVQSDDTPNRITAFNGLTTQMGGRVVGSYIETLHPTGSGLYTTVTADRVQGVMASSMGVFQTGEVVSQPSTGAVGRLISLTGNAFLLIVSQGAFNNSTIVGSSSGATMAPTNVVTDSSHFLERSTDGFADFVPIMNIPYKLKMRGLVDCGLVKFKTRTTRVLLAFDDPTEPGQYGSAYYNLPDIDNNWNVLLRTQLDTGDRSIRHFHGAVWVPGVKKLIVMTGDTDSESSLLVCDDIADLINHPQKWHKRWGLDRAGLDRVNFLNNQGNRYCIVAGAQECRVIDVVPDETSQYAYYIPDSGFVTYLMKIDLAHNSVSKVGTRRTQGYGWMGLRTSSGNILFGAASEIRNGTYQGNSDPYAHLYALTPDRSDVVEVYRTMRTDALQPTFARGHYIAEVEYKGVLYLAGSNLRENSTVGTLVPKTQESDALAREKTAYANMLSRVSGQDILSGVGNFTTENVTYWSKYVCNTASDSKNGFVDSAGVHPSMLVAPMAGSSSGSVVRKAATLSGVKKAAGNWITLEGYVKSEVPLQNVGLQIQLADGTRAIRYFLTSGDWQHISVSTYVPIDCVGINFLLSARKNGSSTAQVWFSNFVCKVGAIPRL